MGVEAPAPSQSSVAEKERGLKMLPTLSCRERGAWVAQSVECLNLDFSSGHDPRVIGLSHVGLCAECGVCLGFSLSLKLKKKKNCREKSAARGPSLAVYERVTAACCGRIRELPTAEAV